MSDAIRHAQTGQIALPAIHSQILRLITCMCCSLLYALPGDSLILVDPLSAAIQDTFRYLIVNGLNFYRQMYIRRMFRESFK
ncbi:MAG: hypothetical protein WBL50_06520 [Candidatus Acidiferrum sp.]